MRTAVADNKGTDYKIAISRQHYIAFISIQKSNGSIERDCTYVFSNVMLKEQGNNKRYNDVSEYKKITYFANSQNITNNTGDKENGT
ncbi:hypothetical protein RHAA1_09971 [Aggregatibacter actinomycetemcomitans RhAA1]|nr:hypothetical protein RHAA1_09971 [Aggregatibacter actinomycetemcomitans RhAA1]KNE76757.1 ABC transporter substrate-binding protein [Aggregatibacter actinomycetemcomitans RhAA1]